jgi:hypothetical protein
MSLSSLRASQDVRVHFVGFFVPAGKDARPPIRVMGGDLAPAVAAALGVLASEPDPLAAVYVRANLLVLPTRVRNRHQG